MNHNTQYFSRLVAAFIRGQLDTDYYIKQGLLKDLSEDELEDVLTYGKDKKLKLYPFKRNRELPRIKLVLSFLRGVQPESLLDIGTGRGVFMYPFLDEFDIPVTCSDLKREHIDDLQSIKRGGYENLEAVQENVCSLPFEDNSFDVVTALEVLEHIEDLESAFKEIVRVAKDWIICSMPSKPDDNEEHIHLFDSKSIKQYFSREGITNVKISYVHEHIIVMARKS